MNKPEQTGTELFGLVRIHCTTITKPLLYIVYQAIRETCAKVDINHGAQDKVSGEVPQCVHLGYATVCYCICCCSYS